MEHTDQSSQDVQSYDFERRKLLKGAAWSVPVIAMAIAAPAAAASTVAWNVRVSRGCGLSIAGQSGLAGFTVTNDGTEVAPGPITLTLVDAYDTPNHFGSGAISQANMRAQAWVGLTLFSVDLITTRSSGVNLGGWSDVQYERIGEPDWLGNYRYKAYRTRTVTLPALAPGESKSIGWLLNVSILPGSANKVLTLTSDTGSVTGDESAVIDPNVLVGC